METSVPTIGKKYHFFDDGKLSPSRHYIATVKKLLSPRATRNLMFDGKSLYDIWREQIEEHTTTPTFRVGDVGVGEPWLYSRDTDYFVELSVPDYDENYLYAVRTIRGTWFTLCIQSFWQGGVLDVDNKMFEQWEELWPDKYYEFKLED